MKRSLLVVSLVCLLLLGVVLAQKAGTATKPAGNTNPPPAADAVPPKPANPPIKPSAKAPGLTLT